MIYKPAMDLPDVGQQFVRVLHADHAMARQDDDDNNNNDDDDDDDDNRVSGSLMLSMQWLDKMCGVTPTSKDSTPSTTRQQPQEDICQPL